jgi:hypothetical protein
MPPVSDAEYKKLKKWYAEQLKSKEKLVEQLKRENEALMRTALRQAQRTKSWQRVAEEQAGKNEKKKPKSF